MYDLGNLTNSTNLYDITNSINQLSNGGLTWFWMFGIFLFAFMISKKYTDDTQQTLMTSSLFLLLFTVLMFAMGIAGNWHIGLAIFLLVISTLKYSTSGE